MKIKVTFLLCIATSVAAMDKDYSGLIEQIQKLERERDINKQMFVLSQEDLLRLDSEKYVLLRRIECAKKKLYELSDENAKIQGTNERLRDIIKTCRRELRHLKESLREHCLIIKDVLDDEDVSDSNR